MIPGDDENNEHESDSTPDETGEENAAPDAPADDQEQATALEADDGADAPDSELEVAHDGAAASDELVAAPESTEDDALDLVEDGEALTAEELEALTGAFAPEDDNLRSSSDVRSEQEPVVLRYDLVGSSGGQRHDFPALDLIHQTFTLTLGTILERETRREGAFVANQPEMMNFSEVYASLPMPTGVVVVEVTGLGCTGLVLIEPGLLVHLIDLLMGGGSGAATQSSDLFTNRSFTGTERLIISRLVEFVDSAARSAWEEICPVSLRQVRAEVDPRHAAVFGPSDRVCEFRVDIEWDDVVGDIRLIVPMEALRPFEKRLALTTVSPPTSSDSTWTDSMQEALMDVPVELKGIMGRAAITLRQLIALKPGDCLRLDRAPEDLLEMEVEGMPLFAIKPTVQRGNVSALLVDELSTPDEDDRFPNYDVSQLRLDEERG